MRQVTKSALCRGRTCGGGNPSRTGRGASPAALWGLKASYLSAERTTFADFIDLEAERHLRIAASEDTAEAFKAFSQSVFADGALPAKTKQLIAVAVAHVTQCPYCIRGHSKVAIQQGATAEEIMEAIWGAVEMRAGAAYAHSILALDAITHSGGKHGEQS